MALDSKLPFLVLLANSFQLVEVVLLLAYPSPPSKTELPWELRERVRGSGRKQSPPGVGEGW